MATRTGFVLIFFLLVVMPRVASANAERWASATSTDTTGICLSTSPCRIDHAVNDAAPGDTIVVMPGSYTLPAPLVLPAGAEIVGEADEPYPVLHGDASFGAPSLDVPAGGTVRDLAVGGYAAGQPALHIAGGGLLEHISAVGTPAAGAGVSLEGGVVDTVVRDGVIVARSSDASVAALVVQGAGNVALRNITAWGPVGADGIDCQPTGGSTTLLNVLARGDVYDVDATGTGGLCEAAHSNFRPGLSPDLVVGDDNQSANPQVGDAVAGDYRPREDSPLIDAGADDPLVGDLDLDRQDRRRGGTPDIGAYEGPLPPVEQPAPEEPAGEPAPTDPPVEPAANPPVTDPTAPGTRPVDPPVLRRSATVDAASGIVLVRLPGTSTFVPLTDASSLPFGTSIDARAGAVTLTTSLPNGTTQTGTFNGGRFVVSQRRTGLTVITLQGGDFAACRRRATTSSAATAHAAGRRVVRRLWGRDRGGRFRTRGRHSSATVRGTRWLTEDRCDGTLTRVVQGAVDVRSLRTGRVTRIRAGHSRLVRR